MARSAHASNHVASRCMDGVQATANSHERWPRRNSKSDSEIAVGTPTASLISVAVSLTPAVSACRPRSVEMVASESASTPSAPGFAVGA